LDGINSDLAKDSLGRIVAITQQRNDIYLFAAEYFLNGQIKGIVPLDENGHATGFVTYYYEDGRISQKGEMNNDHEIGTWKYFRRNGELQNIIRHNDNGHDYSAEPFPTVPDEAFPPL
jgi:antitoxin component YwqK of YwqJK toxin-antitoxin module